MNEKEITARAICTGHDRAQCLGDGTPSLCPSLRWSGERDEGLRRRGLEPPATPGTDSLNLTVSSPRQCVPTVGLGTLTCHKIVTTKRAFRLYRPGQLHPAPEVGTATLPAGEPPTWRPGLGELLPTVPCPVICLAHIFSLLEAVFFR